MTLLLAVHLLTGDVTYYGNGVFEQVYANRLAWAHVQPCPRCVGMIALADPAHLGKRAYLTRPGCAPEGPFLVTDSGVFQTPGRVAEVDYQTAQRWQMRGPVMGVTVFVMEAHR